MKRFGFVSLLLISLGALASENWPQFLGPNRTGSVSSFETSESSLALAWRIELGSGYSGIAVGNEHLYTMYSDGDCDVIAAFDIASGTRQWKTDYAARYIHVGGSQDGPISTPALYGGMLYCLGTAGELLAVEAKSGAVKWQHHLANDLGGKKPLHGFSCSPLVVGDSLVVVVGNPDGKSIAAFEKNTGAIKWTAGNDAMDYQSPSLLNLAGRTHLMVPSSTHISGFDATNGSLLWRHENANGIQTLPLSEDTFLIDRGGGFVAFKLVSEKAQYRAQELWQNELLELGFDVPVVIDDLLIGYKGDFLTALDRTTGERLWKERTGKGSTLLLGDQLVLWLASGKVQIGKVNDKGYVMQQHVKVVEKGSLTYASYANRKLFVRTLTHLAAVDL